MSSHHHPTLKMFILKVTQDDLVVSKEMDVNIPPILRLKHFLVSAHTVPFQGETI